jgi:hypothetical protein
MLKTIDSREIITRLGVSKAALFNLRYAAGSTMPLPVNENCKAFLYDRDTMLQWIDTQLQLQQQTHTHNGLDNRMANNFLRGDFHNCSA